MRWWMCPKCGAKLSLEIDDNNVKVFKCNVCKKEYEVCNGKLITYIKRDACKPKQPMDKFLDDLYKLLEKS